MSRLEQDLSRLFDSAFPDPAPGPELWEATQASMRRRLRNRRAAAVASAVAVALIVAAVPQVLWAQRTTPEVEFFDPPPAQETPEPEHTEKPAWLLPAPTPPADEPTPPSPPEPEPEPGPGPGQEAPPAAEPARVEVRDYRLVLLDAQGRVLRTLYGDYDPAIHGLEFGMGDVAVRPGSTTRDLAATVVVGDTGGSSLRLVIVSDGGEPQVSTLASLDYEVTDHQAAAHPAAGWSPDGAFLAWLEPDAASRAVLRALRWSGNAPAGEATAPGGARIDPDGVAQADGVTGLGVVGWQADPDQLVIRGYRADASQLSYVLPLRRAAGQLHPGSLGRAG